MKGVQEIRNLRHSDNCGAYAKCVQAQFTEYVNNEGAVNRK